MKTPGERIKEERTAKGWSQQRLADEISRIKGESISRAAVAQWEGGGSKTQRPENFFAAAKALGLNPEWVLNEKGDKYASRQSTESRSKQQPYQNFEPGPSVRGDVPLISWIQAGDWQEVIDNLHPGEGDRIETTYRSRKTTQLKPPLGGFFIPERVSMLDTDHMRKHTYTPSQQYSEPGSLPVGNP